MCDFVGLLSRKNIKIAAQIAAKIASVNRPGSSEVNNAPWDCFTGRKQKARLPKQSHDALSTSLLPGL